MNLFVLYATFYTLPNGVIFRGGLRRKNATFAANTSQKEALRQYFWSRFAYRSVLILNLAVLGVEF